MPSDRRSNDDHVEEADEELLDSRPERPRRPWWLTVLVAAVAVVVAALIVRPGKSDPRAGPSARPTAATATSTAPGPALPAFSTNAQAPDPESTRVPGQCPDTTDCHRTTIRPGTAAMVTAAISNALGRTRKTRITQHSVSGARPSAQLYSRLITTTVPSGHLTLLVSAASDDATVNLRTPGSDAATVAILDNSFVDRYYVRAVLVIAHGRSDAGALSRGLHRLVNDERLVVAHS